MHTKVFCLFDYFKIGVANFQIQVFILTFETVLFLLGGDKHGMSFRNIQGKVVALQPTIQLFEVAINSLIQPSQMVRLVAQTGVISIHGHGRILGPVVQNSD